MPKSAPDSLDRVLTNLEALPKCLPRSRVGRRAIEEARLHYLLTVQLDDRLRAKRWSIARLAREAGVSRSAAHCAVRLSGSPSLRTIACVADALGVRFNLRAVPQRAGR